MSIHQNLSAIALHLPKHVKLVAVSKNQPAGKILDAYGYGQRIFGENRVQELVDKQAILPKDIEWHFIGHLQTNKVRFIVPFIRMIHSIDTFRLLLEVNREAMKSHRTVDCLLEIRIATEETKYGLTFAEARELLASEEFGAMNHVKIHGVMGMATFTDDIAMVRKEFRMLYEQFVLLKKEFFPGNEFFKEISMGMSDDYLIAVEEGSTMVRIGTAVFGSRSMNS
jgi:PLP dependent protein